MISTSFKKYFLVIDTALEQEQEWRDTIDDSLSTEEDARCGGRIPVQVDPRLLQDVNVLVSRLVAKASQLVGNFTTNLAESWMNIRCKFDGGKFINRSQSGSWEFRCMGAGLQLNLGSTWGPHAWEDMTGSPPNPVFTKAADAAANKCEATRKRKATEAAKESRRLSKYSRIDDSAQARRAYSRHDGGIEPDDITRDVSPDHLKQLKDGYYASHVLVNQEQASHIEQST